jgi:hypothetical protein
VNGKLASLDLVRRRHVDKHIEEIGGDSQVEKKMNIDEIGVDLNK